MLQSGVMVVVRVVVVADVVTKRFNVFHWKENKGCL